jgi:hypothetical protein
VTRSKPGTRALNQAESENYGKHAFLYRIDTIFLAMVAVEMCFIFYENQAPLSSANNYL